MPMTATIPATRSISDLRTHLPEIEATAKETGEPIVLVRNGKPALVVMDCQAYNDAIQRERHIRKLREAEIEAKYVSATYSVSESRQRIAAIAEEPEAAHA